MDDDVRMVELLAEARQRCEGLTGALTSLRDTLADVDKSAGTAQTTAEERLDSLCEELDKVTEAANAASTTLGAGSDRAAAAVARVQEEAGTGWDVGVSLGQQFNPTQGFLMENFDEVGGKHGERMPDIQRVVPGLDDGERRVVEAMVQLSMLRRSVEGK